MVNVIESPEVPEPLSEDCTPVEESNNARALVALTGLLSVALLALMAPLLVMEVAPPVLSIWLFTLAPKVNVTE